MKSLFPDSMLQSPGSEMTLENIASKLTWIHEQLHFNHWQTTVYAEHMCTGSLYDYVHSFKDDVIEKLMGYTGRRVAPHKMDTISTMSSTAVVEILLSFSAELKRYADMNGYQEIGNMADSLWRSSEGKVFINTFLMPVIYKITSPSNKIYIGQSWHWYKRNNSYKNLKCIAQLRLYRSLVKYGYDNHIVEIAEELSPEVSQSLLDEREIYWWKYYKDLGFEMLNIREPGRGGKQTEEIRKLMSIKKKGIKWSEEKKQKYRETRKLTGYKRPQDIIDKISEKNRGKTRSIEVRKKMSEAIKGFKMPRESIERMIATKKRLNRTLTDEQRKHISDAHKGKRPIHIKYPTHFRKVIDTSTNKIYESITEAAKENNMKITTLHSKLSKVHPNNTSLRYLDNV